MGQGSRAQVSVESTRPACPKHLSSARATSSSQRSQSQRLNRPLQHRLPHRARTRSPRRTSPAAPVVHHASCRWPGGRPAVRLGDEGASSQSHHREWSLELHQVRLGSARRALGGGLVRWGQECRRRLGRVQELQGERALNPSFDVSKYKRWAHSVAALGFEPRAPAYEAGGNDRASPRCRKHSTRGSLKDSTLNQGPSLQQLQHPLQASSTRQPS